MMMMTYASLSFLLPPSLSPSLPSSVSLSRPSHSHFGSPHSVSHLLSSLVLHSDWPMMVIGRLMYQVCCFPHSFRHHSTQTWRNLALRLLAPYLDFCLAKAVGYVSVIVWVMSPLTGWMLGEKRRSGHEYQNRGGQRHEHRKHKLHIFRRTEPMSEAELSQSGGPACLQICTCTTTYPHTQHTQHTLSFMNINHTL